METKLGIFRGRCVRCAHDKVIAPKACVQLCVLVAVLVGGWVGGGFCEDEFVDWPRAVGGGKS